MKSVVINEHLYNLADEFLNNTVEVYRLPEGVQTCLGAFSPTTPPAGMTGKFIQLHIRPHSFLKDVTFTNNLSSISDDFISSPQIAFAFLECIRKHLRKDTVYWRIVDARQGSFEVFV